MSTPSLEQRVARLEAELAQLKSPPAPTEAEQPWWKKIVGVFADDPYFEEAVARGREYRESLGAMESAAEYLSNLPEKKAQGYSLQEAIATLKAPIETALNRHYTFEEIAQILTEKGIKLNAAELSQYYQATLPTAVSPSPKSFRQLPKTLGNTHRKKSSRNITQLV